MPPPLKKRRRRIRVEYIGLSHPRRSYRPTRPGWWYCEVSGESLPVVKQHGTGKLIFPAGTYAEEAYPVEKANENNRYDLCFHEVIKVIEVIEPA